MRCLRYFLVPLLGVLFSACSSPTTSQAGQMITCTTDPGSGVVLRCEPGDGTGDPGTCEDVDEDGDGEPHDEGTLAHESMPDDDDGDGVSNEDDCDEHEGEDGDDTGDVDLPYDIRPQLGDTVRPVIDAFASEGAQPAAIVSVTMDGGGAWRLSELQNGDAFTVTQDDCDHVGNRDVGRDRVFVTWENADGTTETDHLDIRYCD
jgi:hypothetical protein